MAQSVPSPLIIKPSLSSVLLPATCHQVYLRRQRGDSLCGFLLFFQFLTHFFFVPGKPLFILVLSKLFFHCVLKPLIRTLTARCTESVLVKTTVTFLGETQGSSLIPYVFCPGKEASLPASLVRSKIRTLQPFRTLLFFCLVYFLILLMNCLLHKGPECFVPC